ncbi:hypothetical protein [Desulfolucanica intricata]|uniref:hypothetical protein n=1 Tax=Desulfolucanica intricata TaxID=1285191 RepID=UPI0008366822|nr:hypothetical protein [Desulfolucanica intricata]
MGNNKSTVTGKYIIGVGTGSFILAIIFSIVSETLTRKINSLYLSFTILILIILIGIIADVIGTAVTAATEAPFHARASKKVPGAQQGVALIRNADKVANIANDVIGDIAGTVSGALGISLVVQIITYQQNLDQLLLNILITGLIASLTVGGKAAGKRLAITRANEVIFTVGRLLAGLEKITGIKLGKKSRGPKYK